MLNLRIASSATAISEGRAEASGSSRCSQHDCQGAEGAWDQACPGSPHELGDVRPFSRLGHCRGRHLHDRGVDGSRSRHSLHPVRNRYRDPSSSHRKRFVRSINSECLDQTIFLGRGALVRAIAEYAAHYHDERNHQRIGNVLISGARAQSESIVDTRERLGGY